MKTLLLALLVCSALSYASAQDQPLKVTLLGTGVPDPDPERFGASVLVEAGDEKLLFDCGRGATVRLKQIGITPEQIDIVFLTHLHYDHFVGLPDLWLTAWLLGRASPFPVFGPLGSLDMAENLTRTFAVDVAAREKGPAGLPPKGAALHTTEIREGVMYQHGALRVTAFEVDHGPLKPAFGYRVDYHAHSVVISGDTRYSANLVKFAKGADCLIHAAWLPDAKNPTPRERRSIASAEDAARVFSEVKPKLGVIYHYLNGDGITESVRGIYSGSFIVGVDLTTISIGEGGVRPEKPVR